MDEYIERKVALKIIDSYSKSCTEEGKVVADAIRDIIALITPSCDVAPKSEVERLKKERDEYKKHVDSDIIYVHRIKADVAREIFEEIENLSVDTVDDRGNDVRIISDIDFAELKKKYLDGDSTQS